MSRKLSLSTTVLLLLCASSAVLLVWQMNRPVTGTAEAVHPVTQVAPTTSEPAAGFKTPPRESVREAKARPLFVPSRRPPAKKAVTVKRKRVPKPTPMPTKNLILLGVAMGVGEKLALMRAGNSRKTIKVSEGQWINGWKVINILPDKVVLRASPHEFEVELQKNSGKPGHRNRRRSR